MTTYYWVGGTGNWTPTNTLNWSLTSGGSGGAGVPAATDDVVFQNISALTIVSSYQWNAVMCRNMTVVNSSTYRWVFSYSVYVSGNITTSGTQQASFDMLVCCGGTGITQLISLNASSLTSRMTVGCQLPGVGGATVRLTSSFLGYITIYNSSFDQNSQSLTLLEFYYYGSATQATTCTFTGTITYAQGSVFGPFYINTQYTSVVGLNTATILVGQTNTSGVNIAGYYINLGGNDVGTISNSGSTDTSTSNLYNFNLQLDNITTIGTLTWVSQQQNTAISSMQRLGIGAFNGVSVTIGTVNLTGYSQVKRLRVENSELFSPTRIKLLVTTFNNSGYIDFGGVQWNNTGTISGTSFGNYGNTVNITFTAPKTVYISSTATNTSTGFATAFATGSATGATGLANCPLPQDTVIFASNSALVNNALFYLSFGTLIQQAGSTNFIGSGCYVTYSATFQSGVTAAGAVNFIGRPAGTATLTTNGYTGTTTVGMELPGSTLRLNDAVANLTLNYFTCGTLDLNNLAHTLGQFNTSVPVNKMTPNTYCNTPAVISFGSSGSLNSTGTTNVFNAAGGTLLSFTGTNAYINCSNSSSTTRTIAYGANGSTFQNNSLGPLINKPFKQGNIALQFTAGTGYIQTSGADTFWPSVTFTSGFTGFIGYAGTTAGIVCNGDLIVQGGTFATPSSEQQAFIMMVGDSGGATLSLNAPIDRTVIITQFMQSSAGGTITLGNNLTFAPSVSSGNLVVTGSKFSDGGFTISGCNGVISQSSLAGTPNVVQTVAGNLYDYSKLTAGLRPSTGFFGGSYGQQLVVTGTNSVNPTTGLSAGTYYIGPWYMTVSGVFTFLLYGQSPLQTIVFVTSTELPPGFFGYQPGVIVSAATGATTGLTFTSDNLVNRNITFAGGTYQLNTATPWTVSGTNFTTSGSGTTIALNSGGTATFAGGGYSYPATLNTQTGTTVITGANTFGNLAASGGTTIKLPASTTTSFTSFTLSGVNGSLVNLQSSTSGTQATIYSATTQNTAQYISAKDLNGSGGPWTFLRSVNVSNNTNIVFPSSASAGFFNFF
jgi:hypothetical protein